MWLHLITVPFLLLVQISDVVATRASKTRLPAVLMSNDRADDVFKRGRASVGNIVAILATSMARHMQSKSRSSACHLGIEIPRFVCHLVYLWKANP